MTLEEWVELYCVAQIIKEKTKKSVPIEVVL